MLQFKPIIADLQNYQHTINDIALEKTLFVILRCANYFSFGQLTDFALAGHGFGESNGGFGIHYKKDIEGELDNVFELQDDEIEVYLLFGSQSRLKGEEFILKLNDYLELLSQILLAHELEPRARAIKALQTNAVRHSFELTYQPNLFHWQNYQLDTWHHELHMALQRFLSLASFETMAENLNNRNRIELQGLVGTLTLDYLENGKIELTSLAGTEDENVFYLSETLFRKAVFSLFSLHKQESLL